MPGDAADEANNWSVRVNAVVPQEIFINGWLPLVRVDAVVNYLHLFRIELRVGSENVGTHACGDRNDTARLLVSTLLNEGGNLVATTELLTLPGP